MHQNILLINAIILFFIIQRLTELLISKENEKWLKEKFNAVEINPKESLRMRIFHISWFIALLFEANIRRAFVTPKISLIIYVLLGICMGIRIYTIEKLKRFWTVKILSIPNQAIVTDGLYKYIRHPNYLIVIVEFILIPLLFKAYVTLIIFSIINFLVLRSRIKLEEETLMAQSNYKNEFFNINKLLPFFSIFLLLLSFKLRANEVYIHNNNYNDAKTAKSFIKFEGESKKLGMVTTSFDGYIKDFDIKYELKNDQLQNLNVRIIAKSLDTDNESRNEKMLDSILNVEKYPDINASYTEKIKLVQGEQTINMNFTVKEKKISKPVKFMIEKKVDGYLITGTTSVGIKELGLPDPSIMIAKVKDKIDLKFSIIL